MTQTTISENQDRQTTDLILALIKAQTSIKTPVKNKQYNRNNSTGQPIRYADINSILDSLRIPLSAHNLVLSHSMIEMGDTYGLRTRLVHSTGQFIETWYPLPHPLKNNLSPQAFGSALTYARRYSITSLLSIGADDDDDGLIATEEHTKKAPRPIYMDHPYWSKPCPILNDKGELILEGKLAKDLADNTLTQVVAYVEKMLKENKPVTTESKQWCEMVKLYLKSK